MAGAGEQDLGGQRLREAGGGGNSPRGAFHGPPDLGGRTGPANGADREERLQEPVQSAETEQAETKADRGNREQRLEERAAAAAGELAEAVHGAHGGAVPASVHDLEPV